MYYKSKIFDFSMNVRYKIANGLLMDRFSKIKPSVFSGIGGAIIGAAGLNHTGEKYDHVYASPKFNFGVGAEYEINSEFAVGLQIEAVSFFNDKIDGHFPEIEANKSNDLSNSISLTFRYSPVL